MVLAYGFACLEFKGDKVDRITLSPLEIPGIRFERGLRPHSTQAEFAEVLGLGTLVNDTLELNRQSDSAKIKLTWCNYVTGRKPLWITVDAPRPK